ncbi:rhombosortase [Candidatus Sumerlaeota bacterium]|nr:rhombosortase [Candidatus Sumerlaeota bacterium]
MELANQIMLHHREDASCKRIEHCLSYALTAFAALAAAMIYIIPAWTSLAHFDRALIHAGEFWRLFTGHFAHLSFEHLFWDLLAFIVLGAFCEHKSRTLFVVCVALSMITISMHVLLFEPGIARYYGLSGVDSALFVMLCVILIKESAHQQGDASGIIAWLALLCFIGKVTYEYFTGGATLFVDISAIGRGVPSAHLIGGLIGAATGMQFGIKRCWN